MLNIVQDPDPVLRQIAKAVDPSGINSPKIQKVVIDMKLALNKEDDGVAIAAPQIGHSIRVFIVSKNASKIFKEDAVFINPELIKIGKKKEELSEGCLSVRWKYGLVKRSTSASVRALNQNGNEFVVHGRGLLAQIFQHEIDHLNGVLFVDKARQVENLPPTN